MRCPLILPATGGSISISGLWGFKGLMDVNLSSKKIHKCSVGTNAGVTSRKFKSLER